MNKVIVGGVFAVICLLFVVGYLIGLDTKNQTHKIGNVTPTIGENIPADTILQNVAPKIISKLENNPQNLETLLDCSDKNNCKNETSLPPYQWIRYAQYYYAKALKQSIPTTEVLSDLFSYPNNPYYMRLYQYGDVIIDSGITDTKYKNKYLELFDKSIDTSYFSLEKNYIYYSKTNPINEDALQGSQMSKDKNNGIWVMDYSTNAVTAANAYIMTKDTKYLSVMNNLLNSLSVGYYFDGESTKSISNPPKYSACYSLLATTKAFSATNDKQYLQLSNDLILGNENHLKMLYSLSPSQIQLFMTNPTNVLPCMDALNLLGVYDTENSSVYQDTYNTIYKFLINNGIINTSQGSDSMGMMMITNKIDINSTAWLVKILSENIINNGK